MEQTSYGVFVSGFAGPLDELEGRLVRMGMSQARARQVVRSMPCFVKRDVSLDVAERYKYVFERAGAWVQIENWQTTQNPAAFVGFVARPDDEPVLDFEVAFGTGEGETLSAGEGEGEGEGESEGESEGEGEGESEGEGEGESEGEGEGEAGGRQLVPIRIYRPPPVDPVKKYLPGGIAIAIALAIASYFYGCVRVMSKESSLKGRVADLGVALENYNARGRVVTPEAIVTEVQRVGRSVGIDIDGDEVEVFPDRIRLRKNGLGGCAVVHMPETARMLPAWEREDLLRNLHTCNIPGWIVGIRVSTRVRWGLYAQTIVLERYVAVRRYEDEMSDSDEP